VGGPQPGERTIREPSWNRIQTLTLLRYAAVVEPLTLDDYGKRAEEILPPGAHAFLAGGAGDERSVRANLAAYDRWWLMPRVLKDVSNRSTGTEVLGARISTPILIAPVAMNSMAHPDGEAATVRAAGRAGTAMVLSMGSSLPVETVTAAADGPVWFQMYVGKDRSLTAEVARRAEEAGCSALVVTVDAPLVGGRIRELRRGFAVLPEWFADGHTPMYGLTAPVASDRGATELWDPALSWNDMAWLRSISSLPIILKGILRADDAARAAAEGAAGVIVSNHGGRQLDSTPPALEVLPEISEAVGEQVEILVDGGIRRGTDVLKALALGARAVLVGRPILWGLAVDGANGVARVLDLLTDEFEIAMGLCGASRVEDISRDLLRPA
jgi:4-hydroxymandelate oxidase